MKKFMTLLILGAMLASLTACGNAADAAVQTDNAVRSDTSAASADADAVYIYGQIDSISGNDIVLLLADYHEEENSDEENEQTGQEDNADGERSGKHRGDFKGEKPEGFTRPENGEMPEGFDPEKFKDGEMPEGFDPEQFKDGEKPEGFTRPENGEKPEGFDKEKFSGKRPGSGNSKYTLTGEQQELRIPVGTTVTTSLGVETDFEVLTAGDIIKCSVAKDIDGQEIVTAVWIMEK
jgi:hypothetical protein